MLYIFDELSDVKVEGVAKPNCKPGLLFVSQEMLGFQTVNN